ncbi:TonB-dependent siderophore receptor [Bordetella genomosp. 1]|uniref:TonB-dependent siderophore receptor n=1 Tax=Bordetella genomosp. 1 TaxID=1395607 RepID=A0A261S5S1_9BORD|nr:catecholate siderophore receptor Fiu [Bordetella genomosp. 1]OZI32709.1 TonB-dependent siderophore receptor [Bordetella genomosp. 1]
MSYIKNRKTDPVRSGDARPLRGGAAVSMLATAMLGTAVQAQDVPADVHTLAPVRVIGGQASPYKAQRLESPKFTQPLVDTTQTVQVITDTLIQDQQAETLSDAVGNVAGAGTFFAGENGSTSMGDDILLRGFNTSNSIFVDGIRDSGTVHRDTFTTQQVEVIKGPSGSDYGRGAPSGSINVVSKQPRLEDSFDATLGIGSARRKRSTLDWNRRIGETSAVRVNLMGLDAGKPGRDRVEERRWGVAAALGWGLGTDTRVYLDVLHVKQDNRPDGGVVTVGLPGYRAPGRALRFLDEEAPAPSTNFYGLASDRDRSTTDRLTLRLEHAIGADATVRNITRWSRTQQDYVVSSFMAGVRNLVIDPDSDRPSWTMTRMFNQKDLVNRLLSNQTNLTARISTGALVHDLSAGVEFTRERQVSYGRTTPNPIPVSVYQPDSSPHVPRGTRTGADGRGTTDTYALYAFDTITLSPAWQINGGVRLDRYRTAYRSAMGCGGTGRGAVACHGLRTGTPVTNVDERISGTLLNWKLGAMYRLTPVGNVYANFAVSQQPPGGANFQLAHAGNSANRTDFAPQKAQTVELGTKWDVLERRLLLTAAVFRTRVFNEVVAESDGTYSQNGEKRVQGLELSASGNLTDDWSVNAGFTVQDATVDKGPAVANDGSRNIGYTPRHAFSGWTQYRLPHGFRIGAGVRYVGTRERGRDGAIGTPDYARAYWVFDAMAGYAVSKHLDFQLNVYNLFDTAYVASINKSGYRYFPGAPRSFLLTAKLRY